MAEAGWLGIAMPQAYGGSGLGITEAAVLMQAVAQSGAGFSGASAIHMKFSGCTRWWCSAPTSRSSAFCRP